MTRHTTVTGQATPRSDRITWVVRVDGRTVYGSFDRTEAEAYAATVTKCDVQMVTRGRLTTCRKAAGHDGAHRAA